MADTIEDDPAIPPDEKTVLSEELIGVCAERCRTDGAAGRIPGSMAQGRRRSRD
jgi:hypothetical protein